MADTPTSFFKFIRPPFNLNLSIPRSFLPNLNGWRSSKVILRRGGHEWPVDITGGVFSGEGWRKCVRDNRVQEFDFMVFKHQGNMVFDFLVFDPSTCERQYPNPSGEMDVEEPLTESESDNEEKHRLGDDHCFEFKITPYYIKSSRLISVPLKFARSNGLITKRLQRQVIIRDETQRTWSATLRKTLSNNKMQIHLVVCREFRVKNHLKIGDTCMLELVKRGEVIVFNFYNIGKKPIEKFTRVKKETSSTIKKPIEKRTRVKEAYNSTIKKATRSTSNNHSYFTSTLKPCSFKNSILHLPVDFVKSNDLNIGKMILRDNKSRSWEVLLKEMDGGKRFYLGCGFAAFRAANELKEGDAFKFELVENQKNKPPIINFSCKKENIVPKEESRLYDKDDHPRPYFISKVKSCNIKQSILYLPSKFAKENGLFYDGEIIMRNGKDERSWIAELKNYKNKYCYIGRGLKDFRVANGLKEGDCFKLQIVDNIGGKLVVNVSA